MNVTYCVELYRQNLQRNLHENLLYTKIQPLSSLLWHINLTFFAGEYTFPIPYYMLWNVNLFYN